MSSIWPITRTGRGYVPLRVPQPPPELAAEPWPEWRALLAERQAHYAALAQARQAEQAATAALATARRGDHTAQLEAVRAGKPAPAGEAITEAQAALEAAGRRRQAAVQVALEDDQRVTEYLEDHRDALTRPLAEHIEARRALAVELAAAARDAERELHQLEAHAAWLEHPGKAIRPPQRRPAPAVLEAAVPRAQRPAKAAPAGNARR